MPATIISTTDAARHLGDYLARVTHKGEHFLLTKNDQPIAEHHADIFAELTQSGTMIPQNDIAVAATARCLGCGVLVGPRDEAHFRRIASLQVRVLTVNGPP
jgi:predicted nucleic acid-binding protein